MYTLRRKGVGLMPAIALAGLSAIVMMGALSSSRFYAAGPQQFTTVTVQPGDSLWTIADRQTRAGSAVQDTLDAIRAANRLAGAAVFPGQRLKIPITDRDVARDVKFEYAYSK
jgi:LysM repeat protein